MSGLAWGAHIERLKAHLKGMHLHEIMQTFWVISLGPGLTDGSQYKSTCNLLSNALTRSKAHIADGCLINVRCLARYSLFEHRQLRAALKSDPCFQTRAVSPAGGGTVLSFLEALATKGCKEDPAWSGYYIKDLDLYSELAHLPAARWVCGRGRRGFGRGLGK
eukprot:1158362-Pelagomonas_calceolata.AAC.4